MYVYVQGIAKTHNSALIISIEYIRPAAEEEIDVNDFLEVVPGGVDIWMDRLHDHIELIKDVNCRALVCAFLMEEKICLIKGFPAELGLLLKHMIFSHHGSLEFGSPVRPATPEALALHHIENLDAKMNHLYCFFKDSSPDDNIWSNYDKFLSTEICRMRFKKELCAERQLEATLTEGR